MGELNFNPLKCALFIHVVCVKIRQTLPDNVAGTGFIPAFGDANFCRVSKQHDRTLQHAPLSRCTTWTSQRINCQIAKPIAGLGFCWAWDGGRKSNHVGKMSFLNWSLFERSTSREAATFSQNSLLSMVPVCTWPVYIWFALSERQRLNSPPNLPSHSWRFTILKGWCGCRVRGQSYILMEISH